MKRAIIYKVTNIKNGKMYVGSTTKPLSQRWSAHCSDARRGKGSVFQNAIRKYTPAGFTIEEICNVLHVDYLDEVEDYFINFYDCTKSKKGYNFGGVQKGTRKRVSKYMKLDWADPVKKKSRIEGLKKGAAPNFEPIVSVHTQSGEVVHYESVHAAMRDGVAQSAIYFCLNGDDKTGQKRCWFRWEKDLVDKDYQDKALALIGAFKTNFTIPIIAINVDSNVETEFKDVYDCAKFLGLKVKNIRRHIKGDKGYDNHVKGYKFKYAA